MADRYSNTALNRIDAALIALALDLAEADRVDGRVNPKLAELAAWGHMRKVVHHWFQMAGSDAAKHHTWAAVGGAIGITRQGAFDRFGHWEPEDSDPSR